MADVQTGLGPFLAAYLAANSWNPSSVGFVLTFGGLMGVALQTPAGAIIDATHRKRALIAAALVALVCGAALLASRASAFHVYASQLLIGGAGPFIGPAVGAITLGLVGARQFDVQFGRNQCSCGESTETRSTTHDRVARAGRIIMCRQKVFANW